LNDGSIRLLLIGKEESGKHYVKREDKEPIFMLYKSRISQLLKKSEDLKDSTPVTESDGEVNPEAEADEDGE
jgi:hypothetical protein